METDPQYPLNTRKDKPHSRPRGCVKQEKNLTPKSEIKPRFIGRPARSKEFRSDVTRPLYWLIWTREVSGSNLGVKADFPEICRSVRSSRRFTQGLCVTPRSSRDSFLPHPFQLTLHYHKCTLV